MDKIKIRGLIQNNLKNIDLDIPKHKIVIFTGVSGPGKSSIVFDTIATESGRQLNETFAAFIRGKLPQYAKPNLQSIENLSRPVCSGLGEVMTIEEVLDFFDNAKITKKLQQLVDVGLSYMTLGQSLTALSGGEIQRIKLAQALNKKGNIYIR